MRTTIPNGREVISQPYLPPLRRGQLDVEWFSIISKPETRESMQMFQMWLRSEETGATDTVLYIKADSVQTAFDYCNRCRPLFMAKSVFPEEAWIEDEGQKLFSTEEMLEIIDGMEEAA